MKRLTFLAWEKENQGESIVLRGSKGAFLFWGISFFILLIAGMGMFIWGISRHQEVQHLKEQIALQQEQLKLLDEKTKHLETKMQAVDRLDKNIRDKLAGTTSNPIGATSQGE